MKHLADFSVSANGKIFALLTKYLYTKPVLAAIREVGTNAIDASRENNIDLDASPVEIEIMGHRSGDEPTVIKFTDLGVGVSPARMDLFVSSLGSSSKAGSSDQNGAFGIGILSVLNVSDQFSIQTTTAILGELKAFNYIVFVGENNVPTYTQIEVPVTATTTGTTVSFPLKSTSSYSAYEAIDDTINIWNPSSRVKIRQGINNIGVDFNPTPTQKVCLLDQPGLKIMGNKCTLAGCLKKIAPIVTVGDVIYPMFTDEHLYHSLLADLDLNLLPDHLRRLWRISFGAWRELSASGVKTNYAQWHRNSSDTAILYLEFAKGEIELPASREQVSDTLANRQKITDRLLAAIAAVWEQLNVDFQALVQSGEILKAYSFAMNLPGLKTISFSDTLSYPIRDLSTRLHYLSNICWVDNSIPMIQAPDTDASTLIAIAWKLFKAPKSIKIRIIVIFDSPSHRKIQITRAGLERSLGTKHTQIGLFLAFPVADQSAAERLINEAQFVALGYEVEMIGLKPPEPKLTHKPKPDKLLLLHSVENVGLHFYTQLDRHNGLVPEQLDQFLIKDFGTDQQIDWYLPAELSEDRINVAYYCFLAQQLGICGSVAFYLQKPRPAFYLELPDAKNLTTEIHRRAAEYLTKIAPDCQQLGFIPGVNAADIGHRLPLITESFWICQKGMIEMLTQISALLPLLNFVDATKSRQIKFAVDLDIRRLNNLLCKHWSLINGESLANQALPSGLSGLKADDRSDGWQTTQAMIELVSPLFPLINSCYGMPAFNQTRNDDRYWNRNQEASYNTLRLLLESLHNILA